MLYLLIHIQGESVMYLCHRNHTKMNHRLRRQVRETVASAVQAKGVALSAAQVSMLNKLVFDNAVYYGGIDAYHVNRLVNFAHAV